MKDNQNERQKNNESIVRILRKITILLFVIMVILLIVWLSGKSIRLFAHDILAYKVALSGYKVPFLLVIICALILLGILVVATHFRCKCNDSIEVVVKCQIGDKKRDIKISPFSMRSYLITSIALFAVCLFLICIIPGRVIAKNHSTWQGDELIGHAGGNIDDNPYTNSKDAVLYNYGQGLRTFEIDFSVSSDGYLVCKHDWDYNIQNFPDNKPVDKCTFLGARILDMYEPMSVDELFELMKEYPDIYIVTDTKDYDRDKVQEEFRSLVRSAKEDDAEYLLDRFIIQLYDEDMYFTVSEIFPFSNYIYTLYQFWDGTPEVFESCARFCYDNRIQGLTCWNYFVTPEITAIAEEYGIQLYAHTENSPEEANRLLNMGVNGLYTDSLRYEDITEVVK